MRYQDLKRDSTNKAVFVQQNLSFDDRFIATLGARHDRLEIREDDRMTGVSSEDDFSETSLRGALTWKVTPEISTYISYAESVAPPVIGVEPERGEQYEIGASRLNFWKGMGTFCAVVRGCRSKLSFRRTRKRRIS